ncbi:MAG: glycosyltransferase family 9 protein [Chloroflexota bacterium]
MTRPFAAALRLRGLRLLGQLRRPRPVPRQPPRSILLIRPDHLGDLIVAEPALEALHRSLPSASMTAWLGPWGEPVWRGHPHLAGITTCPFPGFTRQAKRGWLAPYRLARQEAAGLRGRFDLAVNLRPDFWWGALTAAWAGIPVAGYDLPACRPFLSLAISFTPGRHQADESLFLARQVASRLGSQPGPTTALDPDSPRDPRSVVRWPLASGPAGASTGLWPAGSIAIHAGAGAEVKLWEEEHWATVADGLAGEGEVLLTAGSRGEELMAQRIASHMARPGRVVSGLRLPELADLYRSCRLVLGVDNGPLHLAEAVGAPTVILFGPTDPSIFGPRDQASGLHEVVRLRWRCIPCDRLDYNSPELNHHPCVRLISPDVVLQAAHRVLERSHSTRS